MGVLGLSATSVRLSVFVSGLSDGRTTHPTRLRMRLQVLPRHQDRVALLRKRDFVTGVFVRRISENFAPRFAPTAQKRLFVLPNVP